MADRFHNIILMFAAVCAYWPCMYVINTLLFSFEIRGLDVYAPNAGRLYTFTCLFIKLFIGIDIDIVGVCIASQIYNIHKMYVMWLMLIHLLSPSLSLCVSIMTPSNAVWEKLNDKYFHVHNSQWYAEEMHGHLPLASSQMDYYCYFSTT